jgi:transaldolase
MERTSTNSIAGLVESGLETLVPVTNPKPSNFWERLSNSGSSLWLDTGDIDGANTLWCSHMSGLTTNNTLLNREIQKGLYDSLIEQASRQLIDLPLEKRVFEIGLILNAHHGLKLSKLFSCHVSVELHTNLAHDLDGMVKTALRLFQFNPDRFIIKLPYTPAGLLGARILSDQGVPVNFTLQFSARQNMLSTLLARPAYTNVFLGRIGAYLVNNKLSNGEFAGEKTALAAQSAVRKYQNKNTRLIAASIRNAEQLKLLAGIDVLTIPVPVAQAAVDKLTGNFSDQTKSNYHAELYTHIDSYFVKLEKLWDVSEQEQKLAESLSIQIPRSPSELVERTKAYNCHDLFPELSQNEQQTILFDGKIPIHQKWRDKISRDETAIDSLLNQAGLASFAHDQSELDNRIRDIIG